MRAWFREHPVFVWLVVLVVLFGGAFGWQEHQIRHNECVQARDRWDLASTIIDTLTAKPGTNGIARRPATRNPDLLRAQAAADARSDANHALFYAKLGDRPAC